MKKFKFLKEYIAQNWVAPNGPGGQPRPTINFKVGDIIEGQIIKNEFNSEPATYVQIFAEGSERRIPFSGRGLDSDPILQIVETPLGINTEVKNPDNKNITATIGNKKLITALVLVAFVVIVIKVI